MLRFSEVHLHLGKLHILQGVSFEVGSGEAVGILGRNGVGKTTTLRALMGLRPISAGTIEFYGNDLARLAPHDIPRAGIGYVPQGRGIFPNLTVMENLTIGVTGKGNPTREDYVFSRFPRLRERLKQAGGTLSGGEQQMLAIARCLMLEPKLIVLDEPTEGIMPRLVADIRREIRAINASGVSVLLVEQNVETALRLCDRILLMDKGRIVHTDTAANLRAHPDTLHRYLGLAVQPTRAGALP